MVSLESRNSLSSLDILSVGDKTYSYYSLKNAEKLLGSLATLPCCVRILLESMLRYENGSSTTIETMKSLCSFYALPKNPPTLPFHASRLLAHDEAALSMMTDMAALREEASNMGQSPDTVAPVLPLDVVIEKSSAPLMLGRERMELLRWSEKVFGNVRLIPPGKGTCTPIHIGCLAKVVCTGPAGGQTTLLYPDTALGSDPHMGALGALGSLGWYVDTLDIESIMLGEPYALNLPGIIGLFLTGKPRKGLSATDIALAVCKALTPHNIKGKIIEFHGPALDQLTIPDRVLLTNALIDAGALTGFFPVDDATLSFMAETGHSKDHIAVIEAYAKAQGLWRDSWPHDAQQAATFSQKIEVSLETFRPGLGGLTGPQSHTPLIETAAVFAKTYPLPATSAPALAPVRHGDIVWASLNAALHGGHVREVITAGLVARKARALGLAPKPWVRMTMALATSLGHELLTACGLMAELEAFGFQNVSNISQAFPPAPILAENVLTAITRDKITVASIASGPSEALIPAAIDANVLASPGLVVAYAIAGNLGVDMANKPLGTTTGGQSIHLKELWPSAEDVTAVLAAHPLPPLYEKMKSQLHQGGPEWDQMLFPTDLLYTWPMTSTYVRRPPSIPTHAPERASLRNIAGGRILAVFGDDITTDMIAPQGRITPDSPTGQKLIEQGVLEANLGTYELRSGNYKVMVRTALQSRGIVNNLAEDQPPGVTFFAPTKEFVTYHEATRRYRAERKPLIIVAGKNYGAGPNQEWAAKVVRLLGVHAIIAESFDPAQRRSLIRVGVLPLRLKQGVTVESLKLEAEDVINVCGLTEIKQIPAEGLATFEQAEGVNRYMLVCDLHEDHEITIVKNGGMWAQFIRDLIPLAV